MTTTLPPLPTTEDADYSSARGEQFTLNDVEKLQILDTKVVLESPEGAELEIRPAGFLARGIALVVDEGLKLLIYALFLLLLVLLSFFVGPAVEELMTALTLLVLFTVAWFYGVIFEQLNDGKTPGKVVASIKVTNAEGTPVGIMQSIIRNLFRTVDTLFLSMPGIMLIGLVPSLIPLGVPGLFFILFSKNFRRLGDHLADTIVIYTNQPRVAPYRGVTSPTTLPTTLSLQDQKLLLAFQDRSSEFSAERKIELAEVLEPIHSQHSEDAVNVCLGYANSIRGAS